MKAIGKSRALAFTILASALVASCASPPAPPLAPPPAPRPRPGPPPAPQPLPPAKSDWRDMPRTPGNWTWAMVDGESTASYGPSRSAAQFMVVCARDKSRVSLMRAATGNAGGPISLRTTSASRLLTARTGGTNGWIVADLAPGDALLDAMAFSRGRFMVESPGTAPLYLPSWPEVSRVIEDCR